jgi:hypothetical protein
MKIVLPENGFAFFAPGRFILTLILGLDFYKNTFKLKAR